MSFTVNKEFFINIFLFFFSGIPFFLFMLAFPDDFIAWFLVLLSYYGLLMIRSIYTNTNLLFTIGFILTVHYAVSFYEAYIGTSIGGSADATDFHRTATMMAEYNIPFSFSVGSTLYSHVIAMFYKTLGVSHFLGLVTSNIVFLCSIIVLVKLMEILEIKRHRKKLLLLFGLLPTMVFNTSVLLREPWEILFFLLSVLYAFKFYYRKSIFNFSMLLIFVIGLAVWHNGLMSFAPIMIVIILFWSTSVQKSGLKKGKGKRLVSILLSLMGISVWILLNNNSGGSAASSALLRGDLVDYISSYREGGLAVSSRATYGVRITDTSILGLIKSFPLVIFYYFFAPLPWQITSVLDIYACAESLLRLMLIHSALKAWRGEPDKDKKRTYGYMLLLWFVLEFLWSLGTSNWGTAMRHHLVAYGVLLLVGGQTLFERKSHQQKI